MEHLKRGSSILVAALDKLEEEGLDANDEAKGPLPQPESFFVLILVLMELGVAS